jgi:hypothetical protein
MSSSHVEINERGGSTEDLNNTTKNTRDGKTATEGNYASRQTKVE